MNKRELVRRFMCKHPDVIGNPQRLLAMADYIEQRRPRVMDLTEQEADQMLDDVYAATGKRH